jgi:hypothetical protein
LEKTPGLKAGGTQLLVPLSDPDTLRAVIEAVVGVDAPVPDEVTHCATHGERKPIGYDRVKTLEMERPMLKVRVTLYAKYVCENEPACGVAQPPRESDLVEGNRYGTSIAAEIVTGKLLSDCYSGYQGITPRSDARTVRAARNSHARRKLFSVGEREDLRQREARPVWRRMRQLLDSEAALAVLPKEKFAEALGYLRNQWDAIQACLSDGRLPIDDNETEQPLGRRASRGERCGFVRVMRRLLAGMQRLCSSRRHPFTLPPPVVVLRPGATCVTTGAWRDDSLNRKLPS